MYDTVYFSPFIFGAIWILAYYGAKVFGLIDKKISAFFRLNRLKKREKNIKNELKQRIAQIKFENKLYIIEQQLKPVIAADYFTYHRKWITDKELNRMAERAFIHQYEIGMLDDLYRRRQNVLNV